MNEMVAPKHLPPFQGGSSHDVFLGLKPQAESYCPFGAETEFFTEPLKVNAYKGYALEAIISRSFAAGPRSKKYHRLSTSRPPQIQFLNRDKYHFLRTWTAKQ